jgi:hypothetical protein
LTLLICFLFFKSIGQDFTQYSNSQSEIGSFAEGDFNNDGFMDFIGIQYLANSKVNIFLFTNKKESQIGFTKSTLFQNILFTGGASAQDMDKDGDIDFIFASGTDNAISLATNDGNGVFTIKTLGISGTSTFIIGDIDKDGDQDIIGMNVNSKIINVYTNNGASIFSTKNIYTTPKAIKSFDLADFDGDGDLDVVVGLSEIFDEQVLIFQNNGSGNFLK